MEAETKAKTEKKKKRSPHAYRQCAYCGECEQDALYQWLDRRKKTACFNCYLSRRKKAACGICGGMAPFDWHHIAGRLVSDGDAYSAPGVSEIKARLCINCHMILTRGFKHDQRRRLRWLPPIPLYVALHINGILELWHLWALRKGYLHGFPKIESSCEIST